MANEVYANGWELACKAGAGRTIASFPDVCFTPPENPATPPGVPIPYPNTGFARDTAQGSKTVKITKKEVMLKNKSYFKKSTGDEAGCAAKKGYITSTNTGKVYFIKWSMNVKFEGENVDRHFDMTTDNHASPAGNESIPWMFTDNQYLKNVPSECHEDFEKARNACRDEKGPQPPNRCSKECKQAQACVLVKKSNDKTQCCAPNTTGHHLIEDHWIKKNPNFPNYISFRIKPRPPAPTDADRAAGKVTEEDGPCVCVNRYRRKGTPHRRMHDIQGVIEESFMKGGRNAGKQWTYGEGKKAALTAHEDVFGAAGCNKNCLENQLDSFYGKGDDRPLNKPETQAVGSRRAPTKKKLIKGMKL